MPNDKAQRPGSPRPAAGPWGLVGARVTVRCADGSEIGATVQSADVTGRLVLQVTSALPEVKEHGQT